MRGPFYTDMSIREGTAWYGQLGVQILLYGFGTQMGWGAGVPSNSKTYFSLYIWSIKGEGFPNNQKLFLGAKIGIYWFNNAIFSPFWSIIHKLIKPKMAIILPRGQWYAPSAVLNVPWYCMVLQGIAWYCMVLHCIA